MLGRRGREMLITEVRGVEEESPPVTDRLGKVLISEVEGVEEESPPVPGRLGRVLVR